MLKNIMNIFIKLSVRQNEFSPRPNIHSHCRQHIEHIGSDLANVAAYYKRPDLKCAKRYQDFRQVSSQRLKFWVYKSNFGTRGGLYSRIIA